MTTSAHTVSAPKTADYFAPIFFASFILAWFAFFRIANSATDLHVDALEAWSSGRQLDWSNAKHPPLIGWVSRAWSALFPHSDWPFDLLVVVNSAIALLAVDLISRKIFPDKKRKVILFCVLLLPTYHIFAVPFNADTIQLASWPLATYCFLRSFESRRENWTSTNAAFWAAATGAVSAIALLGKYYSIFLVGGLGLAVLSHPARGEYFRSAVPWISALTFVLILTPHVVWVLNHDASTFRYPLSIHGGASLTAVILRAAEFLSLSLVFLILPIAAYVFITQNFSWFVSRWKLNDAQFLLLCIGIGALFFPVITAIALRTYLHWHWATVGLFLFLLAMVGASKVSIDQKQLSALTVISGAIMVVGILAVAPSYALYRNSHPTPDGRNFYREAAAQVTTRWHSISERPMSIVSGFDGLAFATEYYSADHPFARPFGLSYERIKPIEDALPSGSAVLCFIDDNSCVSRLNQIAEHSAGAIRFDFSVQSRAFLIGGARRDLATLLVP